MGVDADAICVGALSLFMSKNEETRLENIRQIIQKRMFPRSLLVNEIKVSFTMMPSRENK